MPEKITVETRDQDFDGFTKLIKKAMSWKRQMIKRGLVSARAKCPTCGKTDMKITCNIGGNEHLHCHCRNCGAGFME